MTDPLIYGILSAIWVMVTYGVIVGLMHLSTISNNIEVIARAITEKEETP